MGERVRPGADIARTRRRPGNHPCGVGASRATPPRGRRRYGGTDRHAAGQRKGKSFSLFGCNELIDVDRMNRLLTFPVHTLLQRDSSLR